MARKSFFIIEHIPSEPCAVKVASTVLKGGLEKCLERKGNSPALYLTRLGAAFLFVDAVGQSAGARLIS